MRNSIWGLPISVAMGFRKTTPKLLRGSESLPSRVSLLPRITWVSCYARGRGVAQDFAQAVAWYRKAAEQGEPDAQTSLGELCANGDGTPKDDGEAIKWFQKAAEQGDASAQINLGRMFEAGRGISRDTVEAYMWFSLGAAAGDPDARLRLSDLEKRMAPAQIVEGKRRADAWLAQHQRR